MFRIECFVDDKKLAAALYALAGIAIGTPHVQPVANGKAEGDRVVAKNDGSVVEQWHSFAKENHLTSSTRFKADVIKAFTKHIGRADSSYGHFRNQLVKAGVLRKSGKGSAQTYTTVVK